MKLSARIGWSFAAAVVLLSALTLTSLADHQTWTPAYGTSEVTKSFSSQRFLWTDASMFRGNGNITYEHEVIFDNSTFVSRGSYWTSNLPRSYRDTTFLDDEDNFTIGSSDASQIAANTWYYTYETVVDERSTTRTASVLINAQRGRRQPSGCYSTWCIYSSGNYGLARLTAPSGFSWIRSERGQHPLPSPTPTSTPTPSPRPTATPRRTPTPTPTPATGQLVITTPRTLPTGVVGSTYRVQLEAAGYVAPLSWQFRSGTWPFPIPFPASGAITAVPGIEGTFTFDVRATDGRGASATATLTVQITALPATPSPTPRATPTPQPTSTPAPTPTPTTTPATAVNITTSSLLPSGEVGRFYSQSLQATGGTPPYNWQILSGSSPFPNVPLSSNGILSGTPGISGTFGLVLRAYDTRGAFSDRAFTLRIIETAPPTATPTPPPSLTLNISVIPAIGGFYLVGQGFTPNSQATVYFQGPSNSGHFPSYVDGNGRIEAEVTGFPGGTFTVWVIDSTGSRSPTVTVQSTPTTPEISVSGVTGGFNVSGRGFTPNSQAQVQFRGPASGSSSVNVSPQGGFDLGQGPLPRGVYTVWAVDATGRQSAAREVVVG